MKKIAISKAGEPSVLQVQDCADLQPGANEVRIAVKAAAIPVNYLTAYQLLVA